MTTREPPPHAAPLHTIVAQDPPQLRPLAARTVRRAPIPWGVVLAVTSLLSLVALYYYYNYRKEYSAEKARILKERRALTEQVAQEYGTLRGKIEGWIVTAASKPYPGDLVDADARKLLWRERPVLYARVRVEDVKTLDSTHVAVRQTALDGLASCLLRVKGSYGPWTWGEVVARTEMLGTDFVTDVKDTTNDLRLRNLGYALEQYKQHDFPQARDAIRMAEYVVIALDEDPANVPGGSAAFGADASVEQKIASVQHPVRVQVYRLSDDKELLRVRSTSDAQLVQVQGDPTGPSAGLEMRKAQALGCATANDVLEAAGVGAGPSMAAAGSPLPIAASASASASAGAPAPSASASSK